MHALQDLGEALVGLAPDRLAELDLPERLVDAIAVARGVRAHEGRRRQLQYVGKLMRDVDSEPIRRALAERAGQSAQARAQQLTLERWRTRLIEDEGELTAFAEAHPGADLQALRALIRNARKEIAESKPPRAQRELFRMIRELEARANAAPGETGEDA